MASDDPPFRNLGFAEEAAVFVSPSQNVRVLSEGWVAAHGFCPSCGAQPLTAFKANSPVADFRCGGCAEEYELKAKKGAIGSRILDGAYGAMTERLRAQNNPSLMVMAYDKARTRVTDLIVVPRHFFTPEIIEPRRPLGPNARRAGWQGCNILLGQVPEAGRIPLIRAGVPEPRAAVLERWRSTLFLRETAFGARGWLLAVMRVVELVTPIAPSTATRSPSPWHGEETEEFTLEQLYAHEGALAALYPGNNNVRAKIRQQLQVLRDLGWLEFTARRGVYRRVG